MKPDGHRKVAEEAGIPRLKEALQEYGIAEDTYPSGLEAFYLGNWLADNSQVKDPHGVIAQFADADQLQKFMVEIVTSLLVKVQTATILYLRGLAGKVQNRAVGQPPPISALPFAVLESKFTQQIALCFKQLDASVKVIFRNPTFRKLIDEKKINNLLEQVNRFKAYGKFVYPEKGKTGEKIPYRIFSKIFERHYTQYYPHEHLDRPEPGRTIESHRGQSEPIPPKSSDKQYVNAAEPGSGMYLYMADAIRVITGQLHSLDKEWAKRFFWDKERPPVRESYADGEWWHLHLADLGRVVHLIEDFFAHSNFIERVALSKKSEDLRSLLYDTGLLEKALKGKELEEEEFDKINRSKANERKVRKRLKYYAPGCEERYNRLEGIADDSNLYTGYFDGSDAKVAVLEAILHAFEDLPESLGLHKENTVGAGFSFLFGWASEVIEGVVENAVEGESSIHNQITGGSWTAKNSVISTYINRYTQELKGKTHNPAEKDKIEILKVYFEFVRETWKIFAILYGAYKICVDQLKPIWNIITAEKVLVRPQKAKDYTEQLKKQVLESFVEEVFKTGLKRGLIITGDWIAHKYKNTFLDHLGKNRIGSHSLLAKDLPDEPFYAEMFNCAKFVHWVVIHALCRWSNRKNWDHSAQEATGEWIDWEDLLFYFLRHPLYPASGIPTEEKTITIPASYEYLTRSNDETLEVIWAHEVQSKGENFSFEEFLFLNGIEVPYLLKREGGGVSLDMEKLKEWLFIKKMTDRKDGQLVIGLSLNIPFNTEIKIEVLTAELWFDKVLSKSTAEWQTMVDALKSSSNPFHVLPGIYTFKYISEKERRKKVDQYGQLQKELELAYNNKK